MNSYSTDNSVMDNLISETLKNRLFHLEYKGNNKEINFDIAKLQNVIFKNNKINSKKEELHDQIKSHLNRKYHIRKSKILNSSNILDEYFKQSDIEKDNLKLTEQANRISKKNRYKEEIFKQNKNGLTENLIKDFLNSDYKNIEINTLFNNYLVSNLIDKAKLEKNLDNFKQKKAEQVFLEANNNNNDAKSTNLNLENININKKVNLSSDKNSKEQDKSNHKSNCNSNTQDSKIESMNNYPINYQEIDKLFTSLNKSNLNLKKNNCGHPDKEHYAKV